MPAVKEKRPRTDSRIRMYFRVDPAVRDQFKAVANIFGETMEERAERLLRDDIKKHLRLASSS